jgi:hypothetical protein
MNNDQHLSDEELHNMAMYAVEFDQHMRAGDDEMNAKLRIIEQGCPTEWADVIAREFGDGPDVDSFEEDDRAPGRRP